MYAQESSAISRSGSIRTRLILAFVSVVLLPMTVISAMLTISASEGAQKISASRAYRDHILYNSIAFSLLPGVGGGLAPGLIAATIISL